MSSRRVRRRLRRARPLLWLILVLSGLLLLGGALVALQAWQAKGDLLEARSSINSAHQAVEDGDAARAQAYFAAARTQSHRASGRLTGWVWRAYGHLPVAGPVVREAGGLVEVTDVVTGQVLAPLVSSAPNSAGWSGRANLDSLRRTAVPLAHADQQLTAARATLAALPTSRVRPLTRARGDLARALSSLAVDVRDASVAAKVLPSLLGGDRPTRLLLVAQNTAEERATGGLIGAFALLSAQDGRVTIERSGSDSLLADASSPVVDLGADFDARYGLAQAAATWRSANLTPDVPSAGAILAGLSARQLHRPVDGVAFVDPVALSYVLRATGPVAVPGLGSVSAGNAVALLLKDAYAHYSGAAQQPARKEALRKALDQVVVRLQSPVGGQLARELARAVSTGHLQLYATDDSLERELLRSRVAGALPDHGPYLSVVTQDVGGSKLDYYLDRSVTYVGRASGLAVDVGEGPRDEELATVTVQLHNGAPKAGLPPYVTTRADIGGGSAPRGQLRSWVSLYLGPGGSYSRALLNGQPVAMSSGVEKGLTVLSTFVTVDPGQTITLQLQVSQPARAGQVLLWRQQPRLRPDVLRLSRQGGSVVSAYELP